MRPAVVKHGYDWVALCEEHDVATWCDTWEVAYEAAVGHAVVHHKSPLTFIPLEDLIGMSKTIERAEALGQLMGWS
jgi:hypothetical protein